MGVLTPDQLAIVIAGIAVVVVAIVGAGGAIVVKVIQENTKIQKANVESRAELADAQRKATVAQNQMPEQVGQKIDQYLAPILTIYVQKTNEMTDRINALTAEHDKTKQALYAAQIDRQSLATELAKVQKHAEDLEGRVVARDKQLTDLQNELSGLKQAVEGKDQTLAVAYTTIATLRNELSQEQNARRELEGRVDTLERKVKAMETEKEALVEQLNAVTKERDDLLVRAESAEKLVASLRQQLDAQKPVDLPAGITSADPIVPVEAKG